jgi:CBS-domain-containing membrane protein
MLQAQPQTVADLMSRDIIAVHPDDAIGNILEAMERFRFRHLPVVKDDMLVGLVTQKDLLRASSSSLSEQAEERNAIIAKAKVHSIMTDVVLSASPDDPLAKAGREMFEAKVGCLPVVNADGKLVGIVTESDFIRVALWYMGNTE